MLKVNSLLISIFVGALTLYGGYNYVGADEPEPVPTPEAALEIESIAEPNEAIEVTTEVDSLVERMRKSKRLRESPEYKAQQEAERQARIQQWKEREKEKREKELQQERAEKLKLIYYGTIIGIILCVICAITGCDVVHLVATWLFKEYKP